MAIPILDIGKIMKVEVEQSIKNVDSSRERERACSMLKLAG